MREASSGLEPAAKAEQNKFANAERRGGHGERKHLLPLN